jgi:hypothetical protein
MCLILGEVCGNCAAALRLYAEKYPPGRLSNARTFGVIYRRIRETGIVGPSTVVHRRQRTA